MFAKDNKEIVLVAQKLRADKEAVLVVLQQDGWTLEYAAEELEADKEIVLVAEQNN